jgi:hypothetical protein
MVPAAVSLGVDVADAEAGVGVLGFAATPLLLDLRIVELFPLLLCSGE